MDLIVALLSYWPYALVGAISLVVLATPTTFVVMYHQNIARFLVSANVTGLARKTGKSLITWSWCKSLLYWLIISGGTMAELAFLIGAIWMSLNATVHPFILMFISENQTHYLSFLATSAYVALPELIVSLAVIVTIGHIKLYIYDRKNWSALTWAILYGIPALFFAGLSAYTIGESVGNINFTMPEPFVIARALAGFLFAFTSLLYWQLGKPQEVDRLKKKDALIEEWQNETSRFIDALQKETIREREEWQDEKARLMGELEKQNELLSESKKQQTALLNAVNKSAETALQGYSEECIEWLKSGAKSVTVEEIMRYTGHPKRKINRAILSGLLQSSPRNKDLILVSSLQDWLKQTPIKTDDSDPELMAFGS